MQRLKISFTFYRVVSFTTKRISWRSLTVLRKQLNRFNNQTFSLGRRLGQ